MVIAEYNIKVGDKTYPLKYNNKALRKLEESLEIPIAKIGAMMQNDMSIGMLTEIFRVGLSHWKDDITIDEVDEIIDEIGIVKAADAIGAALDLAFKTDSEKKIKK